MKYEDFAELQTVWHFDRESNPPEFREFYVNQLIAGKRVAPL